MRAGTHSFISPGTVGRNVWVNNSHLALGAREAEAFSNPRSVSPRGCVVARLRYALFQFRHMNELLACSDVRSF